MRACWVTSVVSDSVTPWTAPHQVPLSKGFSRQEYWSGLPLLFSSSAFIIYLNYHNTRPTGLAASSLVLMEFIFPCTARVLKWQSDYVPPLLKNLFKFPCTLQVEHKLLILLAWWYLIQPLHHIASLLALLPTLVFFPLLPASSHRIRAFVPPVLHVLMFSSQYS